VGGACKQIGRKPLLLDSEDNVKSEPGKTKISIRLDNTVLEYFRGLVDKAGGGNYQTLINDALLEHVHRRSTLDVVRQVVREELAPYGVGRGRR
jgi:hypothetical protein